MPTCSSSPEAPPPDSATTCDANASRVLEQQRLFEAEKEKELYGAKIDFFTEIAHEVRTPLTLIKGPLEDIMEMNADPKLEKNLHVIHKNTQRLLELIRQLLDFRNVDSNKMRLDFVRFDIPMQLQCIVERFEPTIEKRGLRLTLRPGEGSFQAAADREALTKIVSNLLNNALKYAEHEIEVALEHNGETFSVRVTSDGEKIPIHLSEKIFEPFFRIDRTGQAPGAGIGLPMARSLAQLHKGHLFLDTAAPGNSFVLTLPLVQEQYINLQEQAETLAELPGEETEMLLTDPQEPTETASSEQDYSVLLVEDNAAIQQYLAGRLRRECVVLTASNGAEALEILHNQAVDLVVSDIMMPGMDGMELCRTMKREENLHSIPLVFLTAKNDMTAKIEGLHIGAEAFIEKPFSFSYLRALIFSIMDNRRKEREAFIKRPFVPVHNIRMSKADEEFINRIIALIEEHMTNEQLNVEWLSEASAHKPFEPTAQGQEHHQPLGGGLHPPDTSEKSGPHAAGRETQDQRSVLRRRHHLPVVFQPAVLQTVRHAPARLRKDAQARRTADRRRRRPETRLKAARKAGMHQKDYS